MAGRSDGHDRAIRDDDQSDVRRRCRGRRRRCTTATASTNYWVPLQFNVRVTPPDDAARLGRRSSFRSPERAAADAGAVSSLQVGSRRTRRLDLCAARQHPGLGQRRAGRRHHRPRVLPDVVRHRCWESRAALVHPVQLAGDDGGVRICAPPMPRAAAPTRAQRRRRARRPTPPPMPAPTRPTPGRRRARRPVSDAPASRDASDSATQASGATRQSRAEHRGESCARRSA